MFSRDLYDPRSDELWGIRVLGTTECTHSGRGMTYFDMDRLNFSSRYTWHALPEEALAGAARAIQARQAAGWVETERSQNRRCFEYVRDAQRKFWVIERDGASHMVHFGRVPKDTRYGYVGPGGRRRTKRFASPEEAQASYNLLIQQKLREGYVECHPRQASLPS